MLRHANIWSAIDRLARKHGMSPSGLARRAGLDPTTFNKSKRITREGKLRWPGTGSISLVLAATGARLSEFVSYVEEGSGGVQRMMPLIGMAQAGASSFFDDAGYPAGAGWDEIPFPEMGDPHAYVLEISGDSMTPVFRDGDHIVVSPQASIRRGDRVVVKTRAGEVMAKELKRQSARRIELGSFNPAHSDRSFGVEEIDWIHRIVWTSQ
ncbi:MAG: helix-turn-helix transcriptional regulator [Proteobacteria bacterium]|nr:helix-turn-helix transcriptional regulator [Pseudomonadota bacterium]